MAASSLLAFLLVQIASSHAAASDSSGLLAALIDAQGINNKADDTLRALDTNGNGKVDKSEITVFAKNQGLSSEEVLADFQELDVNKDGELDRQEISGLLGGPAPAADESKAVVKVHATPAVAASPVQEAKATMAAPAIRPEIQAPLVVDEVLKHGAEVLAKVDAEEVGQKSRRQSSMGLDLEALENDAQQQAGHVIASRLAQRAQVLLARSGADETKANNFDLEVQKLRSHADELAKEVNSETRKAARDTVSGVAEKQMAQLKKLQMQEHAAVTEAAEHRECARKAMERVRAAQESLHERAERVKAL